MCPRGFSRRAVLGLLIAGFMCGERWRDGEMEIYRFLFLGRGAEPETWEGGVRGLEGRGGAGQAEPIHTGRRV